MSELLAVKKVIVMEDRAQVERRAKVELAGHTQLRFEGLPLVAVDRSLRVEVDGATLIDAKFERRWKEVAVGGIASDASGVQVRLKEMGVQKIAQVDLVDRLEYRMKQLALTRGELLRSMAQLSGYGISDPPQWKRQLDALALEQSALDKSLHDGRTTLQALERSIGEAKAAMAAAQETKAELECTLCLTLEGMGEAEIRAIYLVPCAVWRPAYRATLGAEKVSVSAEAFVWQRTGEDWHDVELQFSTARPTLGTSPPKLSEDTIRTRAKVDAEKREVEISWREEAIQSAGENGGQPEMPGLDDGGEVCHLMAKGATTIKSNGEPHRVALFDFESAASVERVCRAEVSNLVYALARFRNTSGGLLLAGPVDLVRNAGLVGRAQLSLSAPGEAMHLSFGNEDGVYVVRDIDEKVDESRLSGRKTTTKKVTLHLSNTRSEAMRLILEERLPVSEVKEVEIDVLTNACNPSPTEVTKDGIARIALEVGAHATKTAKFCWELKAKSNVAGI
jgi:uncharacterized protein (TIGR02231 family)